MQKKTLIVGKGVIGTIYGWALSSAGVSVTHLLRNGTTWREEVHIDIIDERKGFEKTNLTTYTPESITHQECANEIDDFDLIIVPVSSHQAVDCLEALYPLFPDSNYLLASLQWNLDAVLSTIPENQLFLGYPDGGGSVQQTAPESDELVYWSNLGKEFHLESLGSPEKESAHQKIIEMFDKASIECEEKNMIDWLPVHCATTIPFWAGFASHVEAENPVSSFLKDKTLIRSCYEATKESLHLCELTQSVDLSPFRGELSFIKFPFWLFSLVFRSMWKFNKSMQRYTSHAADSLPECAALYGEMMANAEECGVRTPYLDTLGAALLDLDDESHS